MSGSQATPVLFIHGLWIHSDAWEPWVRLFRQAGYDPFVAGWPGDQATPAQTRADAAGLGGVGIQAVTDAYEKIARDLPERPIVVGHSFGGLVAQKLLAQNVASAAVAISPAPMKGVTKLPLAQIRSALPVLKSKANRAKAVALTRRQFRYAFGNAVPKAEANELFERWAIPGPGRPLFEATEAKKDPNSPTAVDTATADRGPLLILGGGKDHTVPEAVAKQAFGLYDSNARTDYQVFDDRGHSYVFDSGWQEIAEHTLRWLQEATRTQTI
jgi:non-heme chloroperoxidase